MITTAIIGHLVGDYLLQNDWMALNKKKHSLHCAAHCALWTLAVCFFAEWWRVDIMVVLFVTHFIQDRTQIIPWFMKTIGQNQFMKPDELHLAINTPKECPVPVVSNASLKPGLGPWSIIVVDNVWHIVTLWAIWRFMV